MHHADPSGVYQPRMVSMMLKCSPGELLAKVAFMHYDDKGRNTVRHYVDLKGLILEKSSPLFWTPLPPALVVYRNSIKG